MKFLRMFSNRLMNVAEDLSSDGGGEVDVDLTGGDASDYSSQNIMGDDTETVFKNFGLDPKKYGIEEDEQEESLEDESQGSDKAQVPGQNTDEKSLLGQINSLGMIHAENPLQVASLDEVKSLIQMGKDYTLKTQSLSEERKAWESEKVGAESELNAAIEEFNKGQNEYGQKLQELQKWTFALKQLEKSAPDVFEEVQRAYSGIEDQFSNPIINQELAAIRAELAETKKGLSHRENSLIIDKFESEKAALSSVEQSMKELGVTVDWDKAKKHWAATGLPLEEAVGSLYFKQLAQAQASKAKVVATQAKVQAKPQGAASAARPGNKVKAIDPKLTGLAYAKALLDRHSKN